MYGELNHPDKAPKLEVMHNCPDVFEKMFGNCERVKLTDLTKLSRFHIEPSTNGTFAVVQNNPYEPKTR